MESNDPLYYQPFAAVPAIEKLGKELFVNVPDQERKLSMVAGAALIVTSFGHKPLAGLLQALAGGALIYRAMTGHCALYEALNRKSRA